MSLSEETLSSLQRDYPRLLKEANEAAELCKRLNEEATDVAKLLGRHGRSVELPAAVNTSPAAPVAEPGFTDAELKVAIVKLIADGRKSGFKPSEMVQRLQKYGLQGPDFNSRVPGLMGTLEAEGLLVRRESDNRFLLSPEAGGSAEGDYPF